MDVPARRVENYTAAERPGDFFLTPPDDNEGGARRLAFLCPCGCGVLAGIKVRVDGQPTPGKAVWAWNRDEEKPTCTPSINIMDRQQDDGTIPSHWHGFLTDGVFRSC